MSFSRRDWLLHVSHDGPHEEEVQKEGKCLERKIHTWNSSFSDLITINHSGVLSVLSVLYGVKRPDYFRGDNVELL